MCILVLVLSGRSRCKGSGPSLVICHLYLWLSGIILIIDKSNHVFERDWTTSSKILNKSRLSSERVWGGMRRNMSSFSMKEDIHFNVKWDIGVESHKLWWGNDNKLDMNWLSVLHEGSQSIPDQSSNIAYMQFMYDQRIFSLCRGSNLRSTSK